MRGMLRKSVLYLICSCPIKGVIGTIVVNNDGIPIKSTLDNHTTTQYAGLINQLVDQVYLHITYSSFYFLYDLWPLKSINSL